MEEKLTLLLPGEWRWGQLWFWFLCWVEPSPSHSKQWSMCSLAPLFHQPSSLRDAETNTHLFTGTHLAQTQGLHLWLFFPVMVMWHMSLVPCASQCLRDAFPVQLDCPTSQHLLLFKLLKQFEISVVIVHEQAVPLVQKNESFHHGHCNGTGLLHALIFWQEDIVYACVICEHMEAHDIPRWCFWYLVHFDVVLSRFILVVLMKANFTLVCTTSLVDGETLSYFVDSRIVFVQHVYEGVQAKNSIMLWVWVFWWLPIRHWHCRLDKISWNKSRLIASPKKQVAETPVVVQ